MYVYACMRRKHILHFLSDTLHFLTFTQSSQIQDS